MPDYTGPHKMGCKKEFMPVDDIVNRLKATSLESPERRELKLNIICECKEKECNNGNCRVDKVIGENAYKLGMPTVGGKIIRDKGRVYKFSTDVLVSEQVMEEGETTIALSNEGNNCHIRAYTKAFPGNGGHLSTDLRFLKELEYTKS